MIPIRDNSKINVTAMAQCVGDDSDDVIAVTDINKTKLSVIDVMPLTQCDTTQSYYCLSSHKISLTHAMTLQAPSKHKTFV